MELFSFFLVARDYEVAGGPQTKFCFEDENEQVVILLEITALRACPDSSKASRSFRLLWPVVFILTTLEKFVTVGSSFRIHLSSWPYIQGKRLLPNIWDIRGLEPSSVGSPLLLARTMVRSLSMTTEAQPVE